MIDYSKALNPAQLAAVSADEGHMLVVAGAGSGKTRVIVYRLAWLVEHGVAPASILLLTFTRKAAHEMMARAGALLGRGLGAIAGGTFHSFAFGALRIYKPEWLEGRSFSIMDSADMAQAVGQCRANLKSDKKDSSFPKTQTIVGLLSKARNKEMSLDKILGQESFHLLPYVRALEEIGSAYAAFKREKGLMDYDDLLFELESLLKLNGEAAMALRLRYKHVLVDEYQDTNLVQARITRLLAGPLTAEAREQTASVMAVGDEAQSIYAFRGANVRNILDFPRLFPGARVIKLEENYRSTQPILNVANNILSHASESYRKKLFTRKEGGEAARLVTPLSDLSEAKLVVRRVEDLLATQPPYEIAVLFRAAFHSYPLESALRQAGIDFRKYGGQRFVEAAHIKDVMAFARLALNPLDLPAFSRVAAMSKGIGPKTVVRLHDALSRGDRAAMDRAFARFPTLLDDLELVERLRCSNAAPREFFEKLLEHYRPRLELMYPDDWPSRAQGLEEILHMAQEYAELDSFIADMSLDSPEEDDMENAENRITLSTIHSAKGLEWNAVLILDLVEDRFPSRHAQARPEDYEEERRLFYVACTRARQTLDLYAPATIYSRAGCDVCRAEQSPFLRELAPGLVQESFERMGGFLVQKSVAGLGDDDCQLSAFSDDCQLDPAESLSPGKDAHAAGAAKNGGYCRHRIFGRGKIVKMLGEDKAQVNFPGFGLKVILANYLLMED